MRHRGTGIAGLLTALLVATALTSGAAAQDQFGQVQFKVSCTAEAQAKFNRAMAYYHSFAWKPAHQTFTEVAQVDPKCGMAWWGVALNAAENPFGWPVGMNLTQGAEAIEKAK